MDIVLFLWCTYMYKFILCAISEQMEGHVDFLGVFAHLFMYFRFRVCIYSYITVSKCCLFIYLVITANFVDTST